MKALVFFAVVLTLAVFAGVALGAVASDGGIGRCAGRLIDPVTMKCVKPGPDGGLP